MIHKRFRFNLVFKTLGEVISRLSSFAYYAIAARLFGVSDFGLFSVAFSYAAICVILIDLGINPILTKEIALNREGAPSMVSTVTLFKLSLVPFVFILLHVVMVFLGKDNRLVLLTDLMGLVAVGLALSEHQSYILSGLERMNVEAWLKMGWKLGALIGAVWFFQVSRTVESFVLGTAVGQFAGVGIGFYWIARNMKMSRPFFDGALLKRLLKMSFPMFLGLLVFVLYDNQDIIILSVLKFPQTDVGYFSASAKLIDALRPVPVLLVGAVFPILTQAAHTNRPLFLKIVNAFLRHTILLIVPCAIVLSLCSSLVVRLMYGDPFLPAAPVFAVGAWAFAGVFINHLLLQMLVGVNRQNDFLFGALIACVVNAVASWLLFKEIGVVGGSWALVISETVLFSYCLFSFLRTVEAPRAILSELLKPAALALVAAIIGWFAGGIAALVVFVVGAFAFRLVDIASLRKMIS